MNNLFMKKNSVLFVMILFVSTFCNAQKNDIDVIAYYTGGPADIDSFAVDKLTHIIFSFAHLKGNDLSIRNAADSALIQKLVSLKKAHPGLKIMLSLEAGVVAKHVRMCFQQNAGEKNLQNL